MKSFAIAIFAIFASGSQAIGNPSAPAKSVQVKSTTITSAELQSSIDAKKPIVIIDVRTPEEFVEGHISAAMLIPLDTIGQRMSEIPTDKEVVLMCRSGRRSGIAQDMLAKAGYTNTKNLTGGITSWKGPLVKGQ